ncbi:MAG: glycosyltransferase family 2 protein [Promethearchaeota archaeon]
MIKRKFNELKIESEKVDLFQNQILKYYDNKSKDEINLISIVIPLFNEEKSIKNVIDKIPNHRSYEIIVVDDGSTDNSAKIIKKINSREIKLIRHNRNLGYGAAILSGFKHARGNIIVTMDSDGQHNPEEIPKLIEPVINNQADLVIGSRYLGKCNYKIPLYTRVGEYFISLSLWLLFLQKIYNNQCGFRAFNKGVLKIFKNMRYTQFGFSTEILFKAAFNKFRIVEIPISINPRKFGRSYVNLFNILKSIFSCILFYTFRKLKVDVNHSFIKKFFDYFYRKIRNKNILR